MKRCCFAAARNSATSVVGCCEREKFIAGEAPAHGGQAARVPEERWTNGSSFVRRRVGESILTYSLLRSASCTGADNLSALRKRRVTCQSSFSVSLPSKEGIAL